MFYLKFITPKMWKLSWFSTFLLDYRGRTVCFFYVLEIFSAKPWFWIYFLSSRMTGFTTFCTSVVEQHLYQETRTMMGEFRNLPDVHEWWNTIDLNDEGYRCSIILKEMPNFPFVRRNWLRVFCELCMSSRHIQLMELLISSIGW